MVFGSASLGYKPTSDTGLGVSIEEVLDSSSSLLLIFKLVQLGYNSFGTWSTSALNSLLLIKDRNLLIFATVVI